MKFYPKALIFDLNGTMVDDMEFHNKAWQSMLNKLGASLSYEEVKKQMYGKNDELLVRVFGEGYFTQKRMDEISIEKEEIYQADFLPHLKLINGLDKILQVASEAKIPMAIGSAAIPFNINYVLNGLNIGKYFSAVVSANDVKISKPNPETFIKCAEKMGINPKDCLVFEDAPKGAEAAKNADMPCIVLNTTHADEDFDMYDNVIKVVKDYNDPIFNLLARNLTFSE
ncbi:HAD family hydrolase [Pedobacter jejuensis]|uniref:HAD family phosphatase n=1 Tax=Pedobacter jejuensis TaxID=1268550 RepID=A0A3N0BUL8_9SPHI|nr:HAD family phosphatase [Pedobacter jejuensis]RNL52425.1 HAD family phosphatase [Pedobacter jejuensis]